MVVDGTAETTPVVPVLLERVGEVRFVRGTAESEANKELFYMALGDTEFRLDGTKDVLAVIGEEAHRIQGFWDLTRGSVFG